MEYIESEVKQQAKKKFEMGHYKQQGNTFMSTFPNLNPLKATYFDIVASEECAGSSFFFESVSVNEVYELNEILSHLFPLVYLTKHPI